MVCQVILFTGHSMVLTPVFHTELLPHCQYVRIWMELICTRCYGNSTVVFIIRHRETHLSQFGLWPSWDIISFMKVIVIWLFSLCFLIKSIKSDIYGKCNYNQPLQNRYKMKIRRFVSEVMAVNTWVDIPADRCQHYWWWPDLSVWSVTRQDQNSCCGCYD